MASATAEPGLTDTGRGILAPATVGLVPYAPLILRVVAGVTFAVYGWNKLQNPAGFEAFVTGLGFPAPAILAWFVLVLEFVGGAALIVGFLVRPIALLFAIEMIVTSIAVKLDLGFAPQGATGIELDLVLLGVALALVVLGPGRASVDEDVLHREFV